MRKIQFDFNVLLEHHKAKLAIDKGDSIFNW
jgi:hypothetical protein